MFKNCQTAAGISMYDGDQFHELFIYLFKSNFWRVLLFGSTWGGSSATLPGIRIKQGLVNPVPSFLVRLTQ